MANTPIAPTPIAAWPDAPQRTDAPAVYVPKADAWVAAMPPRTVSMNALATNVNYNATSAFESAADAIASGNAAVAAANYKGEWDTLTGALAIPASVSWLDTVWMLTESVVDVTAEVPGTSVKWLNLLYSPSVTISARTSNTMLGLNDKEKWVNITYGTFSQTFDSAATLADGWYVWLRNTGTGVVTLDPDGTETIDGASTKVLLKDALLLVYSDGTNLNSIVFSAPVSDSHVVVTTGDGSGSTNTKIRKFTTTLSSAGTAITYATSAADGASFTINEDGYYSISYTDSVVDANSVSFGVSLNSAQLTTDISGITAANRLLYVGQPGVSAYPLPIVASGVFKLSAGDVVRPHNGGPSPTALPSSTVIAATKFEIRKVGV